jgi:prepilin-type N-terminal cleavage/methylation domain-containing protein
LKAVGGQGVLMKKRGGSLISDGGLTMVELLLAMVLFAIVSSIAIPSFRGYIDNTKLKGAARQIMSDIADTQERAKAENAQYRITLNVSPANTYSLDRLTAPAQSQVKTLAEHGSNILIEVTTYASNQVTFEARGILNQAGTITLRNNRNSTAVISTSLAGRTNAQFTLQ